MDILAARKKAAERAREQKKKEEQTPVFEAPVVHPEQPEAASAAEAVPAASPAPAVAAVVADSPERGVAAEAAAEQAQAAPVEELPIEQIELLSFRLGGEEYAVNIDDVKEVLKNRDFTPVPNAPDYILGVTALRGPVLPVIDLSRRLGIPAGVRDEKSRIVVVTVNDEEAGIVVDRVTGVVRISPDAVRPVPETIEKGAEFLRGIARKGDKLYILLDIQKTLGM